MTLKGPSTARNMQATMLNIDILFLIADFIQPDPFRFLELARVSKMFKTVFTSDRVWRYLNPYGAESNIFDTFRQIISRDEQSYNTVLKNWRNYDPTRSTHPRGELFSALGMILKLRESQMLNQIPICENRQVFWCAVRIDGESLRWLPESLKDEKDLHLAAVYNNPESFWHAENFHDDKDVVLLAIERYALLNPHQDHPPSLIAYISERLLGDPEVGLELVKLCGHALSYLSEELQKSRELVLAAVKTHGEILEGTRFLCDREIVSIALETDYTILELAENLQDDDEVVAHAVKFRGEALMYASSRLRNDEAIVSLAVSKCGGTLAFASSRLQDTRAVALAAIKNDSAAAWEFVSKRLRDSDPIIFDAWLSS